MGVDVELVILSFLKHSSSQDGDYNLALRIIENELQCRDGDLETDGNTTVQRSLVVSEDVDDDLCRRIGAQLAELGDRFEREGMIKKEVVECVVQDLLTESLSEKRFSDLIKSVLANIPPGIEQEKASVAIALTLTKEVGCTVPNLLQNFFHYTAGFIRGNYLAYLQQYGRQGSNDELLKRVRTSYRILENLNEPGVLWEDIIGAHGQYNLSDGYPWPFHLSSLWPVLYTLY